MIVFTGYTIYMPLISCVIFTDLTAFVYILLNSYLLTAVYGSVAMRFRRLDGAHRITDHSGTTAAIKRMLLRSAVECSFVSGIVLLFHDRLRKGWFNMRENALI